MHKFNERPKQFGRRMLNRIIRGLTRPPFRDELGNKGWFKRIARAHPHLIRSFHLQINGWPKWSRALRIAFLSDFHVGSHFQDVARLESIVVEALSFNPDLILLGGDFVNMQPFGGGRVPPRVIAAILGRLKAPNGCVAVLGNHDYTYGASLVAAALQDQGIIVLDHECKTIAYENSDVDIVGLPDAHVTSEQGRSFLSGLHVTRPTIVLAHDPAWFGHVPNGPYFTLAGHTHGGQIKLPGIGVITNASEAPLRWTHGLIVEEGRHLYVSSGLGTSGIQSELVFLRNMRLLKYQAEPATLRKLV